MKKLLILFFLLLSVSNCNEQLIQISWNGTYITSLNTEGTNYFYVAINNLRTSGNFELCFGDYNFYLNKNLYFTFSKNKPSLYFLRNYNFSNSETYSKIDDSSLTILYYYSFNYKKLSNETIYAIFRYSGSYSTGTFKSEMYK